MNIRMVTNTNTKKTKKKEVSRQSRFLHHLGTILTQESPEIIRWCDAGEAFEIRDLSAFERRILPKYFRPGTKWKSFQRQLNNFQFRKKTKRELGSFPKCVYTHVCPGQFQQSNWHQHQWIKRGPALLSRKRKRGSTASGKDNLLISFEKKTFNVIANPALASAPASALALAPDPAPAPTLEEFNFNVDFCMDLDYSHSYWSSLD